MEGGHAVDRHAAGDAQVGHADLAVPDDRHVPDLALVPKLEKFAEDKEVLLRLDQIKRANKESFAKYAKKAQGFVINPDAIFDVQVKRLHEYKRQLLNVMHIIHLYHQLQDNPNMEMWAAPCRDGGDRRCCQ